MRAIASPRGMERLVRPYLSFSRCYGSMRLPRTELSATIARGLRKLGKDTGIVAVEDLAAVDEFHTRGRMATLELMQALDLSNPTNPMDRRVLDVGCGLGGATRTLASHAPCHVIGVDLSSEYVAVATDLAEWTGLSDRVDYIQADATALPFDDASFDVVYTQHASMSISDKPRLFKEMTRVLRQGGKLGLYDVLLGSTAAHANDIVTPLPWGTRSFLSTPEEVLHLLMDVYHMHRLVWDDKTTEVIHTLEKVCSRRTPLPPPLGLHLVMGFDADEKVSNLLYNAKTGKVRMVLGVFVR